MGCDAHLTVVVPDRSPDDLAAQLAGRGRRRLRGLEQRWSRFLVASEVSRLGRRSGRPVRVSADTRLLVRRAVAAWELTAGLFDPTVAVSALGYDRTFDRLPAVARTTRAIPAPGPRGIRVDDAAGTVRLPRGVAVDPGAVGKGLAADLAAADLIAAGALGACVNVGGDVRVTGPASDGTAWRVGVPCGDGAEQVWAVEDGGVATSSPARRRWSTASGKQHHLVDPRTGRSVRTHLRSISVAAPTGWQAEVVATTGAVGGWAAVEQLCVDVGGQALAVTTDGVRRTTAGLTTAPA